MERTPMINHCGYLYSLATHIIGHSHFTTPLLLGIRLHYLGTFCFNVTTIRYTYRYIIHVMYLEF